MFLCLESILYLLMSHFEYVLYYASLLSTIQLHPSLLVPLLVSGPGAEKVSVPSTRVQNMPSSRLFLVLSRRSNLPHLI